MRRKAVRWTAVACALALLAGGAAWYALSRLPHPPDPGAMVAMGRLIASPLDRSPAPEPPADPRTDRERLLTRAFGLRGQPYVWGAKGPDAYDCSGFTKAAYGAGGVKLPDGSFNQAEGERPLEALDALTAGDLIFYRWSGSDHVSHVTLYAGDGWVIGTGSPGQAREVTLYPLADDLVPDGRVITYRHVTLRDEQ